MSNTAKNLNIPDMDLIKSSIEKANSFAFFFLGFELFVTIYLLLFFLDWNYLYEIKLTVFIITGLVGFESISDYIMLITLNKIKVDDLKNDTVLGFYSKQKLLDVVNDSLKAMGLGYNSTSVFITREKSANASAIKTGINPFFKSLNAIYINRTMLHILQPDELKFIIGHELAHNFRYRLLIRKYGIVHFIFSTAIAFAVLQYTGASSYIAIISVFILLSGLSLGLSMIGSNHNKKIEYLCDFEGANIAGPIPAINSLLKTGAQAEAELFLQMSTFLMAHKKKNISASEILEIYELNMPFGKIDTEAITKKIEAKISQKAISKQGLSIKGFFEYLNDNQNDDDSIQHEIEKTSRELKALEKMPKINWAEGFLAKENESLSFSDVESIVKSLLQNEGLLFRLPDEVSDSSYTQPSFRNRVLSLWYNTAPWRNP